MQTINTVNSANTTTNIRTVKQARKAIEWKDLRTLTRWQVFFNLLLPYPFLAVAWVSAFQGHAVLALIGWFLFFTASFRQAHDGFHGTLGIGTKATDALLCWSSGLIMTSNHAIRETHMQHHRNPLSESDIEAKFYDLQWWQAIVGGTAFWLSLQKHGLVFAKKSNKSKIYADVIWIMCMVTFAIAIQVMFDIDVLLYHFLIMSVANSLVGFLTGWVVHHGCGEVDGYEIIARTERNKIVNFFTFNMLFHMEHHLFPSVPAHNLPKLAQRLDIAAPEMVSLKTTPELKEMITGMINNSVNHKNIDNTKHNNTHNKDIDNSNIANNMNSV